MRPYSIRKEDSKYIQPSISNATGNQPSPLALLAATCSKIGDTFLEDTTIFTQKNLSLEKDRNEITTLKSCVDIRPNVFDCVERTDTNLQNTGGQTLYSPNTQISPCMKIKHEENFDYNQNCEGLHICPNVIAETRMLDSQTRASFGKSSHREIQSTCGHGQDLSSDNSFNLSNSSCEHSGISNQGILGVNSCVFQSTCTPTSSSNYPLEHLNLQTCTLSHMPPINPTVHYSGVESFHQRQKQYNWQSQQTFQRSPSISTNNDNYNSLSSCDQTYSNGSYDRHYRNTLSHLNAPSQTYDRHQAPMNQTQEQYHHDMATNCNTHGYHYESYMDVKQESYNLQQVALRQNPSACMGNGYPTEQTHALHHQQQSLPSHLSMPPVHNHPVGMPSSYCSLCNPQGTNYLPDLVPATPSIANTDLQNHNMAEYQYQQQQMLFARDNRRPRRIACTCPNCRDGENKTVTTKDGKQRKLHVCHIPGCGKIYGKTSHLRAHLRWHAGERPFACNWLFCNKRFTRSDELQRHRRTHTGDKRFECSVCLKKFMRSDHLSKHMKTHQSQKQTKEKVEIKEAREANLDPDNKMKI